MYDCTFSINSLLTWAHKFLDHSACTWPFIQQIEWLGNSLVGVHLNTISTSLEYLARPRSLPIWFHVPSPVILGIICIALQVFISNSMNFTVPFLVAIVLGNMHSFSVPSLSWNWLQVHVPTALGNMHLLSYVDVSYHALKGAIPSFLINATTLLWRPLIPMCIQK